MSHTQWRRLLHHSGRASNYARCHCPLEWRAGYDASPANVQAKNKALKAAGAIVPESFEGFESAIKEVYQGLVQDGTIIPQADVAAPAVPQDLEAAKKAGKVSSQMQSSQRAFHPHIIC